MGKRSKEIRPADNERWGMWFTGAGEFTHVGGTSNAADPWDVSEIFGEPGGATYGFSVVNHSWPNGTLTFQIPDGAVTDLAGNPVAASNVVKVYLDVGKPTTSGPRPWLRSGVTLGSGQRVLIGWSGADVGPSGIASYDVARSTDGKAFNTVAIGVTTPAILVGLAAGHAYRYEVRAHDKAGNIGYWRAGPTFRPSVAQQNNSLVKFAGPTTGVFSAHYSGGSERALAAGSSATLKTTARSLSFVTAKGPGRGQVAIYIDGVRQATINLANAASTYRYVAFSKTWYSAGTHTIKVVAVGGRVDVDAFGIIR